MSLEAWGDEDPGANDPECRRCEESAVEHASFAEDAAMLIRRLARSLQVASPGHPQIKAAKDFLMHSCEPTCTLRTLDTVLNEVSIEGAAPTVGES